MRRNTWYNLYILHNIIHFICVPIYLRKSLLKRRSFLCVCAMPSLCGFLAFQLFHFDIAISIDGDGVCIFSLLHLYASKFSTIRFELSFQFFFLPSLWSASNGCLHCTCVHIFYCLYSPCSASKCHGVINLWWSRCGMKEIKAFTAKYWAA